MASTFRPPHDTSETMELFAAAGLDVPPAGADGRRRRGVPRSLRTPLFNYKVVQRARELVAFAPTSEQINAAQSYARKVKHPNFAKQKETAVRNVFIQDVLQTILGYRAFEPDGSYNISFEKQIRAGAVDVAVGSFNQSGQPDELVAPFELKGPMFAA